MQPSGTVVVLTNVDGANKAVLPAGYAFANGVIAWSSPAGGAAFGAPGQGIANDGKLLAESQEAGDMPAAGAVALDATHILTYGDSYPFGKRRDGLHARRARAGQPHRSSTAAANSPNSSPTAPRSPRPPTPDSPASTSP